MSIAHTAPAMPYNLDPRFADCDALVAALEATWAKRKATKQKR